MPDARDIAFSVRPVAPGNVETFRALRIEALRREPLAFTADLAEAEARPIEVWREHVARGAGESKEVVFVAAPTGASDAPDALLGMAGVYTMKEPKLAHAGTVWGVYVREPYRGRGVGAALVRGCVDWARGKGLLVLK